MKLQGKNGTTCLQMLTVSLRGRGGAYSPYTLVKLTVKKVPPFTNRQHSLDVIVKSLVVFKKIFATCFQFFT